MSVSYFIPEIWSSRLNESLKASLIFGNVVNRDYEGEIRAAGDTVHINTVGPVTIGDYTGADITSEELTGTQTDLIIDQKKFFNFLVDDVDAAQANVNLLQNGMVEAAYGLASSADTYIASLHAGAGITTGLGTNTTPLEVNSANVYKTLLGTAQKLTENNVPLVGRWAIVPAWMYTKLVLAKLVVENTSNTAFENAAVGRVAGFDIYVSNNVANTTGAKYKVLAGTRKAISFAGQILKTEAYRKEAGFKDGVKGLFVYGAKVVYPDALACITANETAEP